MTTFKVGDRVRYIGGSVYGLPDGYEADVIAVNSNDGTPIIRDLDGDVRDRVKEDYILIGKAENELATLRAFREQALARFPELAEAESDAEAARRFAIELCASSKLFANEEALRRGDEGEGGSGCKAMQKIAEAIAWARANPR